MLTLKLISEETERVVRGLEKKHFKGAREAVGQVLAVDKRRREAQQQLDSNLSEAKKLAAQIGALMKEGKKDEANAVKESVSKMKETNKQLEDTMNQAQQELTTLLCQIPNIPYDEVPEGVAAEDNRVVKSNLNRPTPSPIPEQSSPTRSLSLNGGGHIPTVAEFDKEHEHLLPSIQGGVGDGAPLPHWELAKKYNLIDFDLGGYTEIMPPTVVNAASGYGTGQLPDKEGQMYHCEVDDFYLIPTAEVPVTNIYRDVILDETQLPIKNCAYTECFRREAGSYGKDVRGLNRLHEFSKIEIVRIDKPEHSKESHREMLEHVEGLLKKLELPYRILLLCGGDQSFTSAICYDFEVYSEAQGRWLEVSSVSNFDTYQANRLKCRYRNAETKKPELCHTLNGSALALPRIVAALLENNQTPDGIRIPKALVPYTGFEIID